MPLVLDADIGSPTANAYADVAEADEELAYRVGATQWPEEGDEEKIQDLVTAARELDQLPLRGDRATAEQALEFPRIGVDANGSAMAVDEIPYFWWLANIELANWYAAQRQAALAKSKPVPDLLNPLASSTKRAKSGDDEIEFFAPAADASDASSLTRFPPAVQRLIAPYVLELVDSGWGSAEAIRAS